MLPALISYLLDDDTHSTLSFGLYLSRGSAASIYYVYLGARAPLYSKFKRQRGGGVFGG